MTHLIRADVLARHLKVATTQASATTPSLTRLRRGACVLTSEWDDLFTEGRLRTRIAAIVPQLENERAVVALQSAAAMHGLPTYRSLDDRVDLIMPGPSTRHNSSDVVRHHMTLRESDVVVIDGYRVTSLARTVFDVVRTTSLEAAVVCFDAALRQVAWDAETRTYDESKAARFRDDVLDRIARSSGARGIRQARTVTELADGRAQLPGESVSRVWMWLLGVPAPELQYRVELPGGRYALLDFAWPRLGRWAEFDGEAKYTDPVILAGRSPDDVRDEQEFREQAVRSTTGWRCDRWGFAHMATMDEFAAHLRGTGFLPA